MAEKSKIFVTGGSGFIGRHVIRKLAESGFTVTVLTRKEPPQSDNPNIAFVKGDILNIAELNHEVSACSYFIHMAGEKRNEQAMARVNVDGTQAILDELAKHPHVKLVLLSSVGVYGIERHPDVCITEKSAFFPTNLYEKTKLQAEERVREYAGKKPLKYVILRPSNVFGEFDAGKKLLSLMNSLKNGRFLYLDRSAKVNYVYVKFLVDIMIRLIEGDLFKNEAYNVNSPCLIEEFIETLKKFIGVTNRTICLPKLPFYPMAKIGDALPERFQIVNSSKYRELTNKKIFPADRIKTLLNLEDDYLLDGLENLVRYYQKEGWL